MVYAVVDSVIYQVALLLSNNGLYDSEQCISGYFAPFLHQ